MRVQGLFPSVITGKKQTVVCASEIRVGLICICLYLSGQVTSEAPKSQANVHPNYSSDAREMTNDVQRDQSASPSQRGKTRGVHSLPTTTASSPTDPPFISFPVTKTPGRATPTSNMSLSRSTGRECLSKCLSLLLSELLNR